MRPWTSISFATAAGLGFILLSVVTALALFTNATHTVKSQVEYGIALFAVGVLPIVLFCGALYSRLKSADPVPTEAEIDSVYYLGFLITLITLICTVVSIAVSSLSRTSGAAILSDAGTLAAVSFAFALSLSATALALFARIALAAFRDRRVADASIGGLEERVSAMILQVDLAYSKLTATISQAIGALEGAAETQGVQFATQLKAITGTIQQDLRSFAKGLADDISSSGLVESLSTATASFRRNTGEMVEIVETMKPLRSMASKISLLMTDVAGGTSALKQGLEALDESIRRAGQSVDALPTDRLQDATRRLTMQLDALGQAVERSDKLLSDGMAADRLQDATRRLTVQLDALGQAVERSDKLLSDGMAASSGSLSRTTRQLQDASDELGRAFTGLSVELAKTAEVLAQEIK